MALTKIDDRGLKTPIDLIDNEKIRLGTGNDFAIYHSGSENRIEVSNGNFFIDAVTQNEIMFTHDSKYMFRMTPDAGVRLYYDNSVKLETKSDGVEINGHLYLENDEILKLGSAGGKAFFWHDGTNLTLRNYTGNFIVEAKSNEKGIQVIPDGAVEVYHDNVKRLETSATGVTIPNTLAVNDGANLDGDIKFKGSGDGDDFFWDKSANQLTLTDSRKIRFGDSGDLEIYHDGNNHIRTTSSSAGYLMLKVDSDNLYLDANEIRMRSSDGGEILAKFIDDGKVELYHNNVKTFTTETNGIASWGEEGNDAYIYLFADEGDDQPDQWRIRALSASSTFEIQNRNTNASYDTNIVCTGDGKVALNYDNAMKIETKTDGVTIQGDIGFVHAGNGLDFGANSHASGMSSEKFDQYEDGTWTPTLHNGTCTTAHCYYRLIGRQCTLWGRISAMSDTSTNDMVKVQSLPFGVHSGWGGVAGGVMASNISEEKPWQPYVDTTSTGQIRFYASHSAGFHQLRHNELGSNHEIYFMVTYPIA